MQSPPVTNLPVTTAKASCTALRATSSHTAEQPEPPVASLVYELDVHDIVAAARLQVERDPELRRRLRRMRWGMPVFVLLMAQSAVVAGASWVWAVAGIVLAGVFWLALANAGKAGVARDVRRRIQKSSAKGLVGRHEIHVTESGFFETTDVKSSHHRWPGLDRVIATDDCLFLYVTPLSAYFVPRSKVVEGDYGGVVDTVARFTNVQRAKGGEPFELAKQAGDLPSHNSRRPARTATATGLGFGALMVWSVAFGPLIVNYVVPRSLPQPAWWLTYNLLIALPGIMVASHVAAHWPHTDRECRCRRCDHLLKGLTEPRCTECGEPI